MPRTQPQRLDPKERASLLDLLWSAVAGLKTKDETKAFFKDLLSETEAIMLARRISIARRLLAGESYQDIMRTMRTSQTTIASVHRWLQAGFGGYERALREFEAVLIRREANSKRRHAVPYSYGWLKARYPLHFLLFRLFDETELAARIRRHRRHPLITGHHRT